MHALAQAIAERLSRPDPRHRLLAVVIGDEDLLAECEVTGRFLSETLTDPAEGPDVEVRRLWLADLSRDVSGLMENPYISEAVTAQCYESLRVDAAGDDPDAAYERLREAGL